MTKACQKLWESACKLVNQSKGKLTCAELYTDQDNNIAPYCSEKLSVCY